GAEDNFRGVVDLVTKKAIIYVDDLGTQSAETDVPAEMVDDVEAAREALLEAVAEVDDELMAKYLEGEEITPEEIRRALRKGCLNLQLVPVLCGSAFKNKGIQPLLDADRKSTRLNSSHVKI